jgi:hypothetical protein
MTDLLPSWNDTPPKVNIELHIGRRPILAAGNSDGDIEMLEHAEDERRPWLCLLLHHDAAAREYAYDQGAEKSLQLARERGWTVVSMKDDFKTVFPLDKEALISIILTLQQQVRELQQTVDAQSHPRDGRATRSRSSSSGSTMPSLCHGSAVR